MTRTLGWALAAVGTLAFAAAGCDCSGGGQIGRRDAGPVVVGYDDAGRPVYADASVLVGYDDGGHAVLPPVDGGIGVGTGPGHFTDPGNVLDGVSQNDAGFLVLDRGEVNLHFAWLANPVGFGGYGSVSKIDTKTGKEVARYVAVLPTDGKGARNGLRYNSQAHASSRTAVDLSGNVWLANRAFGGLSSVTKIANSKFDCVDRNKNGKIDTSSDVNGDGVIDPGAAAGEVVLPANPDDAAAYDECLLFTQPIGTAAQPAVARALAIDSGDEGMDGSVWVGLWCGMSGSPEYRADCMSSDVTDWDLGGGAFVKLSPSTGELQLVNGKNYVAVPIRPYGAAVDAKKRVWFDQYPHSWVAGVDGNTGAVLGPYKAPKDWGGYGMTVQVTSDKKTRVWVANIGGLAKVSRFDVDAATWSQFDFGAQLAGEKYGYGRGIAVDDKGVVWMSAYVDQPTAPFVEGCRGQDANPYIVQLVGIDSDSGAPKRFPNGKAVVDVSKHYAAQSQPEPCNGLGVGMDNNNRVWVASANGYATGVDRTSGQISLRSPDVGDLYTYSDFTGYTLRTFTAPQGRFETVFTGCAPPAKTRWLTLNWDALVLPNTTLKFWVRSAATRADLALPGTKYGPFDKSPADLVAAGVPEGSVLKVEVQFVSQDKVFTPSLRSLYAVFACDGSIN